MNILFTICGRAGSKGVKNKNLKKFLDYPLIYYTISIIDLFIKNTSNSCDIALNTDSVELSDMVSKNIKVPIINVYREETLSGDRVSKLDVIRDTYLKVIDKKEKEYNMIIDLDLTSPLRTFEDLMELYNSKGKSSYDVVFSVTEARRNPYFNMVKSNELNEYERVISTEFNSRQEAPEIYDMNASMYAYSPDFLKSDLGIFGGKCGIIKMKDTGILDIDSENDFELMEVIGRYLYNKYPKFKLIESNIENIIDVD